MTTRHTPTMTLPEFEHLLDVYGGDRTRWPLAARAGAAARLASDTQARRLLQQAEALDAVLLHTAEPGKSDIAALADRIVAATRTTPRLATSSAASPSRSSEAKGAAGKSLGTKNGASRDFMRGAALLAASLMIGVFVGQSQFGANAVPVLEELTSFTATGSADRLAMLDLHIEAVDED